MEDLSGKVSLGFAVSAGRRRGSIGTEDENRGVMAKRFAYGGPRLEGLEKPKPKGGAQWESTVAAVAARGGLVEQIGREDGLEESFEIRKGGSFDGLNGAAQRSEEGTPGGKEGS